MVKPRILLGDIIRTLPCKERSGGESVFDATGPPGRAVPDGPPQCTPLPTLETDHSLIRTWITALLAASVDTPHDREWWVIRDFAAFYLYHTDVIAFIDGSGFVGTLSMSLEEIIKQREKEVKIEIDIMEEFYIGTLFGGEARIGTVQKWVNMFEEEGNEELMAELAEIDDGAELAWQTIDQIASLNMGEMLIQDDEVDMSDDEEHSAKEPLKKLLSIIDEDVKDLIPEGIYLQMMNELQKAYNCP
jgi:hypothetical protein